MNLDECKAVVVEVADELVRIAQMPPQVPKGAALFIAKGKLQAVVEGWPAADAEMARLMKFEKDARNCLMGGYGIQPATWQDANGKRPLLRILDDKQVMKTLGIE